MPVVRLAETAEGSGPKRLFHYGQLVVRVNCGVYPRDQTVTEVVQFDSVAAIAVVEGYAQRVGPVAEEINDVAIAADVVATKDASCYWKEGGVGCWIVEEAY
jgi:hypothetical protein